MHNRGRITRHHLIPKERQKNKTTKDNQAHLHFDTVLKLYRDNHDAWHQLFKNMTLPEIIECLQRIQRIKSKAIPMRQGKHKKNAA